MRLRKDIIVIVAIMLGAVAINKIASAWFFRIDLTAEKRFTLSSNTTSFLKEMKQQLLVKVYLDGDLNPGFKKLSTSAREMLDEFKVYADDNINYQFVDPNSGTMDEKKALASSLAGMGCEPVPVYETAEDGSKTRSMVFPYAVMQYGDKQKVINLLDNIPGFSGAENLNKSIEGLEYKLMTGIRLLTVSQKPRIAFLEGHGELDEMDVVDVTSALSEYYQVERGRIADDASILDPYKVVIIAKPQQPFAEKDKFAIDQYIMKGGRVLWLVDAVNVTLDSLQVATQTMGMMSDFNISDQLFKYGIRINPTLVEDIQAGMIPVNTASPGKTPKFVPVPWLFNPLLQPADNHPITKNINVVKGEFTSSIDTVGEDLKIKRTALLHTSRFTRVNQVPVFISLAMVSQKPQPAEFNKQYIPVAYAQEGVFASVFQYRAMPAGIRTNNNKIIEESVPTRMVFVADGDMVKNGVRHRFSNPQITPLGYDELSHQTFGNKDFIVNSVNYLADDEGWMKLRSRSYTLRLLNKEKLGNEAAFWKILNVVIPAVVIVLAGVGYVFLRKRRYVKK
jgi:ABC-2 type transport system permease protein